MALILPARYRQSPPGPAHIDWTHPLARGLVYYSIGNGSPDLVSQSPIQRIGSATLVQGLSGLGYRSNANTTQGWYSKYSPELKGITNAYTISTHAKIETLASNGKIVCIPLTNSSWVAPYFVISIGALATGTALYLFNHPGAGAGGTPARVQFGAGTLNAGEHRYIVSRDGTTAEALIDGSVSSVVSSTLTTNNVVFGTGDSLIQMERTVSSLGEGMTGEVYHVAVWNRALTQDEKKQFDLNPYQILQPARSRMFAMASSTGIPAGDNREAEGDFVIPMQTLAGEAEFPNLLDPPSTWTTTGGPGTVDTSDTPWTFTINSAGGTPTYIRDTITTLTIGNDYRLAFKIATNTAQITIGTSLGGTQYKAATSSSPVGLFDFEFRATSATFGLNLQRTTAGTTVISELVLQQLNRAIDFDLAGGVTIPMITATGTAENIGLWQATGAATIPFQGVTGAGTFVETELEAEGAVTIPMQQASGAAVTIAQRNATGGITIPMQQASGASQTRYNSFRILNGSNQHFEWTPAAGTVSNRNLGFYGFVRFDITPLSGSSYYMADFGNLTAGTGGTGRIRLLYDATAQQFVGSTASTSGTYMEARSPATPITVGRWYFVGISISSTGQPRVIVNKTKTSTTTGTLPAAGTDVCQVFRIGTISRTTPTNRLTGAVGTWFMTIGFVPTDDQLDQISDGAYAPNVVNTSSTWAMVTSGATEPDRISTRTLTAVNSPTLFAPTSYRDVNGTATIPMQQATGASLFIGAGSFAFAGGVTIPMQTVAASIVAEPEGIRGNWNIPMQTLVGAATRTVPVFSGAGNFAIPMQRASGVIQNGTEGAQTFYVSTITNNSGGLSLSGQEMRVGLPLKRGDVPSGWIVRAFINGAAVKTQISRRRFWDDGSLKYGEASFEVPVTANGQTVNVEWRKSVGTWTAQDTGLHSGPTAIINHLNAEWRAVSWINRPTPSTFGTEIGPLHFRIEDMLDGTNGAWIKTVYTGHLVTEYEATLFGVRSNGEVHPDFAAKLYVRAWGGTASTPRRIEFGFKSMYGWSDNSVPADAFGYRVSWDLLVNNVVIRGSSIGTTGWSNVNGFKGGSHFSFDTSGKMDWYDVGASSQFVPPSLVHKHRMEYLIDGRFLPPIDLTNSFDNGAGKKATPYVPGGRGLTFSNMSDVGDRDDIGWPLTGWTCRTMLAHSSAVSITDVAAHQQTARTQALAVGSIPCQGYRRATRDIVPHAPADRISDARLLPTNYNDFSEIANGSYTSYSTLDEAHFPNLSYFNYLTEGNHHTLQLVYGEAGAPASFTSPFFGKATAVTLYDVTGTPVRNVGHQVIRGQIRGIARHVTQIGCAVGIGHPDDLEHIYYTRQLEDWCVASSQLPQEEDNWRGGTAHVDNYIYRSANDPIYKPWMHTLVTGAISFIAGLTRRGDAIERANWWVEFPRAALGGYNDGDIADKRVQSTIFTFDEIYYTINPEGGGTRAPFPKLKQWGSPVSVTYGVDGQTVTVPSTSPMYANNTIITPFNSATPIGLTRGQPYYAVELSGQVDGLGGTCKLATTPGGTPVTWAAITPVTATATVRSGPPEAAAPVTPANNLNSGQNSGFGLQMIGSLKTFYHAVGPNTIVQKALEYIEPYKQSGGWAEKAKYTVTFTDAVVALYPVTHNGEPVTHNGEQVYAPIPPDTYSGGVTIPMQTIAGMVEFAPGLDGDTRGAVTIPMQIISGEITAPELVFEVVGNCNIPMQTLNGTTSAVPPSRTVEGTATIPFQVVTGAATNAPVSPFGNFLVPMQTISGAATFVNPIFSLDGNCTIPMQTVIGEMLSDGSPIQGSVTIPFQIVTGELTSEQFAYEMEGDFIVPMIVAVGEAVVNAFDMSGDFVIPHQEINGAMEITVPTVNLDGNFSIPMIGFNGEVDNNEPDIFASGDFVIPFMIIDGDIQMELVKDFVGNFVIPMQRWGGNRTPQWVSAPETTDELWTVITPE